MSAIPRKAKPYPHRRGDKGRAKARPWAPSDGGHRQHGLCPTLGPQDQECVQVGGHLGWHLSACGVLWDDEGHVQRLPGSAAS